MECKYGRAGDWREDVCKVSMFERFHLQCYMPPPGLTFPMNLWTRRTNLRKLKDGSIFHPQVGSAAIRLWKYVCK